MCSQIIESLTLTPIILEIAFFTDAPAIALVSSSLIGLPIDLPVNNPAISPVLAVIIYLLIRVEVAPMVSGLLTT